MTLTISRRLGLLVGLAIIASCAAIAMQLMMMRSAMLDERKAAIRGQVQAAASIVNDLSAGVAKGQLSDTEAQQRAKAALRAIRYGNGDFLFVYSEHADMVAIGTMPLEGKSMWDAKDPTGFYFARAMVDAAMRGGGFTSYMFARPGQDTTPYPKISYSLEVKPWNWIISTGVYVDDLDAAFYSAVRKVMVWAALLIGALCVAAIWLSRGLVAK